MSSIFLFYCYWNISDKDINFKMIISSEHGEISDRSFLLLQVYFVKNIWKCHNCKRTANLKLAERSWNGSILQGVLGMADCSMTSSVVGNKNSINILNKIILISWHQHWKWTTALSKYFHLMEKLSEKQLSLTFKMFLKLPFQRLI